MIKILFFSFLAFSTTSLAQGTGVFMVVKGNVTVSNGGGTTSAKVGASVNEGDKITAAKDSWAKIVMVDKNVLNLTPESEVVIENYKSGVAGGAAAVTLNIVYGKLRSTLNRKYKAGEKFHIKTPAAVAGVRGTDFLTTYSPPLKEARVVTFAGQVAVGTSLDANGEIRNPVLVSAGQRTIAGVKGVAPATAVATDELVALNRETTTADTQPQLEITTGLCLDKILAAVGQQTLMKTVSGAKVSSYKIINVQVDSWAPQKTYTVMSLGVSSTPVKFEKVYKFTAQPDSNCQFRLVELE